MFRRARISNCFHREGRRKTKATQQRAGDQERLPKSKGLLGFFGNAPDQTAGGGRLNPNTAPVREEIGESRAAQGGEVLRDVGPKTGPLVPVLKHT